MNAKTGYGLSLTVAVVVILLLGQAARVSAGDIIWTGGDETWFDTGNWNLGRLPAIALTDYAGIQNNGTARIEAPGAQTERMYVGGTGSGHLYIGPGGTFDCSSYLYLQSSAAAYHSEVVVAGGTATVARIHMQMSHGPALVQVTGGALRVAGSVNAVFAGGGGGWLRQGLQTLEVCGAGRVEMTSSTSEIEMGSGVGTEGHLDLHGNGILTNLWRMALGHSATGGLGVLTISNNATLNMTGNLHIGGDWDDDTASEYGASGIVRVIGGAFRTGGDIYPGYYGTGILNVDSGRFECAGNMILGYNKEGNASVQQTGGTVDIGSSLYFGYSVMSRSNTTYNLSGGKLRVRVAVTSPMTNKADAVFNLTGGAFSFWKWIGTGPSMPDLVNAGATMSPGLENAGFMVVETNYVETSSACRFRVDLGGVLQASYPQPGVTNALGYYDHVNVWGGATLMGSLDVKLINGFEETVKSTDKFYVMASGSNIAGAFANVASGERVTTLDKHSFLVYYGNNAATTGAGMDPKKVTLTGFRHFPRGTTMCVR
ncbi:MAG: hypothetical protein PHR35_19695 [Kiritimatiellae bacterium]|nr:hypothetical protein [Kiritimatiellia bacterium]